MCRERMSHIMEAYARQPRPLEQRFHVMVRRVRIHGVFRFYRVGEYPLTQCLRLAPPQDVGDAFRQDDGAHALVGLCLAECVFALLLAVQCAAHLQRPGVPVEVAPLQTANFTAAQTGHQLRLEEVPPDFILLYDFEESVQLSAGEDALRLVVGLRRCRTLGRVLRNDMRLHRVLHRGVEH